MSFIAYYLLCSICYFFMFITIIVIYYEALNDNCILCLLKQVVHQGMRSYFFSADTQEDMLGWVRALSQSASMEPDSTMNRYNYLCDQHEVLGSDYVKVVCDGSSQACCVHSLHSDVAQVIRTLLR